LNRVLYAQAFPSLVEAIYDKTGVSIFPWVTHAHRLVFGGFIKLLAKTGGIKPRDVKLIEAYQINQFGMDVCTCVDG